MQERKQKLIIR